LAPPKRKSEWRRRDDGIASEIDKLLVKLNRLFARLNTLQCELLKIQRYGTDDEAE
jgi:hypothetical protein